MPTVEFCTTEGLWWVSTPANPGLKRSKVLEIIPCPQDGYTPEGLCNKEFGVGAAVIYIRPLQKDIDLKVSIALKCT